MQRPRSACCAATAAVAFLLLLALVSAAPPPDKVMFKLRNHPGGARALGLGRLQRVLKNSRSQDGGPSVDDLIDALNTNDDMGVDLDNEQLIFACAGLNLPPETLAQAAAATAAAETAAAAAEASLAAADVLVPNPLLVEEQGGAAALAPDSPGHHHHHHHRHHHRHLMQGTVQEWEATAWQCDQPDVAPTSTDTFKLHSRPSAVKKVFLDFSGHTTTNTAWNSAYGDPIITTPSFDTDGNPTSYSSGERLIILSVFRSVAEDFAPFNVDITTEDPSLAGAPLSDWVRVAIGGSSSDWYGSSAAGVAYVNTAFKADHYKQPVFVFSKDLGGNSKYISDAASHEIGHSFGLWHDGRTSPSEEYYYGHSTPSGGWAPIMGVGYYQTMTQWSKGEYMYASQKQDDAAVIAGLLPSGGYAPQVHGSSTANALALSPTLSANGVTASVRHTGVIRMPSDAEFMSFAANAGTATLSVLVAPSSRSNLNMRLTVFNPSGVMITSATRSGLAVPQFSFNLAAAGTYYISIAGNGDGADATTGYTSYGSRGMYQLQLSYPAGSNSGTNPPPTGAPAPAPPPTGPAVMSVINMAGSKSGSSRGKSQVTCTVTFSVVDSNLAGVASAVGFRWDTGISSVTNSISSGNGGFSVPYKAPSSATYCTFTVTSVTATGYVLDALPAAQTINF